MSIAQDLIARLNAVASAAEQQAAGLGQFTNQFSTNIAQVQAALGNAPSQADRQMIQSFQQAEKAVTSAAASLRHAATAAKDYTRRV